MRGFPLDALPAFRLSEPLSAFSVSVGRNSPHPADFKSTSVD